MNVGLPPLVWGEALADKLARLQVRITPTSVGRSYFLSRTRNLNQDYPH